MRAAVVAVSVHRTESVTRHRTYCPSCQLGSLYMACRCASLQLMHHAECCGATRPRNVRARLSVDANYNAPLHQASPWRWSRWARWRGRTRARRTPIPAPAPLRPYRGLPARKPPPWPSVLTRHWRTCMPPSEPPTTTWTRAMPSASSSILCRRTVSRMVTCGKSGPYAGPRSAARPPSRRRPYVKPQPAARPHAPTSSLGAKRTPAGGRVHRDWRAGAVGRAEHVGADDEEDGRVERLAAAEQRAPPVRDVAGAGERVADDHDVVAGRVQGAPRLVRDAHGREHRAAVQPQLLEHGDLLVRDHVGERRAMVRAVQRWRRVAPYKRLPQRRQHTVAGRPVEGPWAGAAY